MRRMRGANREAAGFRTPIDTRHSLLDFMISQMVLLRPRVEEFFVVLELFPELGAELIVDMFTVVVLV